MSNYMDTISNADLQTMKEYFYKLGWGQNETMWKCWCQAMNYAKVTAIDDFEAELSATKQRLEPLRREVAMLRDVVADALHELRLAGTPLKVLENFCDALSKTQATAEAYEREVAAKALEDAAGKFRGSIGYNWTASDGYANAFEIASELDFMAAELRAKGE